MKTVIVMSSITYALKAQEILKNNSIYANVTRSRAVRSIRGCGYGVSFEPSQREQARSLLLAASIPIIGETEEK